MVYNNFFNLLLRIIAAIAAFFYLVATRAPLQRREKIRLFAALVGVRRVELSVSKRLSSSAREGLPLSKFSPGLFQKAAYPFRVLPASPSRPRFSVVRLRQSAAFPSAARQETHGKYLNTIDLPHIAEKDPITALYASTAAATEA